MTIAEATQEITEAADLSRMTILASDIGSKTGIEGWPTCDLAGLVKALKSWTLEEYLRMDQDDPGHPHARYSAPYRGLAWGNCVEERAPELNFRTRYVGTKPIHEGHPHAVRYCGNFINYSFAFWLDTDDVELIKLLDGLIAENMASPAYRSQKLTTTVRRAR